MNSTRRRYIELLEQYADDFTPKEDKQRDAVISGELIEAGYLTGASFKDRDGSINGAAINGLTVKGRIFLDQLREQENELKLANRLKKSGLITFGFLMGIIAPIVTDLLKQLLGIK